jgi:hypothetical protein
MTILAVNDGSEAVAGILMLVASGVALAISIVWVIFPFLILGRVKDLQETFQAVKKQGDQAAFSDVETNRLLAELISEIRASSGDPAEAKKTRDKALVFLDAIEKRIEHGNELTKWVGESIQAKQAGAP